MNKTLKAIIFGVVAYIGTSVLFAIVVLVYMLWFMEDERIKSGYEYLFPIPQTEYYLYLADDYPYVLFAFTKDTLMDITDSTDYIVAKYYDRFHDYKADVFFTSHDQICIFLDHMLTYDEDWFACLHDSCFHVFACASYHEGFQQVGIYEKSSEKLAEYIKARLWIVGSYGVCWTDSCKNVNYINYTAYPTLLPIHERPISNEVRFIFSREDALLSLSDANVGLGQNKVRKENTFSETLRKWTPLSVLNPRNWKMAPQFIGSYTYFGEPSKDGEHINNVIYDSKNVRSLFLHIPHSSWNQPRSVYQNRFGNTYQFYVWQSSK